MIVQLLIGATLLVICVSLHVVALDQITRRLYARIERLRPPMRRDAPLRLVILAALGAFLSHIVQIWVWAYVYILLGEFDAIEPAFYFSTASFTTAGFGDVVLSNRWRVLGSFEAAAGMFLFGLSAAYLFALLREVQGRLERPVHPDRWSAHRREGG